MGNPAASGVVKREGMKMTKLKPCPFCGANVKLTGTLIICPVCSAEMSGYKVVQRWNTRNAESQNDRQTS